MFYNNGLAHNIAFKVILFSGTVKIYTSHRPNAAADRYTLFSSYVVHLFLKKTPLKSSKACNLTREAISTFEQKEKFVDNFQANCKRGKHVSLLHFFSVNFSLPPLWWNNFCMISRNLLLFTLCLSVSAIINCCNSICLPSWAHTTAVFEWGLF